MIVHRIRISRAPMNISFRCKLFDQVFIDAEHVIPYPEMITSVADAILQGSSFAADIVHLDDPVYSPERIQFNSLIQKILAIFLRFNIIQKIKSYDLPSIRKKIGAHII